MLRETLKMEAAHSTKILVCIYQTTQHNILQHIQEGTELERAFFKAGIQNL
jgi:hypothetical protein